MNQSELEANTCNRRQARENACEQVVISLGRFWFVKKVVRIFFNQLQSKAKPRKTRITFDAQLRTALLPLDR